LNRKAIIALGIAATFVETALWHGPLGAGDELAGKIEKAVRAEIRHQEMFGVTARLERGPLRRRIVLTGPADDFQQAELARILDQIPGVAGVRWTSPPAPSDGVK
jgi:hypothetical protein